MGFKLERFCHCCTLRTGSLIIGTLGWVFAFAEIFEIIEEHNSNSHDANNSIYAKYGHTISSALVSTLLVYGIYKANRGFILPWLVFKGVEIGLFTILAVFIIYIGYISSSSILVILIVFAILVYFWLCVWSHYREIGESNPARSPPDYTAPPTYTDEIKLNPV